MTTIKATDDTQYGSAANGRQVGSGYDCEVKRLTDHQAIACVSSVGTDREWMCLCDVEPDTNLQQIAIEIARCPELGNEGWSFNQEEDAAILPEDDGWDRLAERWNDVTVNWDDDSAREAQAAIRWARI
jgi:hypothetical protein